MAEYHKNNKKKHLTVDYWKHQLQDYHDKFRKWEKKAKETANLFAFNDRQGDKKDYKTYKDVDEGRASFNILNANIQVLLPALYGAVPNPIIKRRYDDPDPIARLSSQVLERTLRSELDTDNMETLGEKLALDVLLGGRAVTWVMHEREEEEITIPLMPQEDGTYIRVDNNQPLPLDTIVNEEDGNYFITQTRIMSESSPLEYVHGPDFAHMADAKDWDDNKKRGWVGRKVTMTKEEGKERFGSKFLLAKPGITYTDEKDKESDSVQGVVKDDDVYEVWEIWSARYKCIAYYNPGAKELLEYNENLEEVLKLDGIYPCVVMYGQLSNESLIPILDFDQYRGLARELQTLTERIYHITREIKIRGGFRQGTKGMDKIMSGDTPDGTMVAIQSDEPLSQNIFFFPIEKLQSYLSTLIEMRENTLQKIYEISGISDIVRGHADPREKATTSQLKGQFASQRMGRRTNIVANAMRDILRMKTEIIAEKYDEKTIFEISGFKYIPEVSQIMQQPVETEEDYMSLQEQVMHVFQQVMQLIRGDIVRKYRIDVESESTIYPDRVARQEKVNGLLNGLAPFIQGILPVATQMPELAVPLFELLKSSVRSYELGRDVEASFDSALEELKVNISQPPPEEGVEEQPPPEPTDIEKNQSKAELHQMNAMTDIQKAERLAQIEVEKTRLLEAIKSGLTPQ